MSDETNYNDLGLVNTKEMFKRAMEGNYAIPAYNFNNMEQLQGIIMGCVESRSPVILQVSGSARKYANPTFLPYMAMGAVQMAANLGVNIPIALHLDHGDSFELAKSCIDSGFSSVMLDGSHHPFEENAQITKQVVDYAHERNVTVEGELGVLAVGGASVCLFLVGVAIISSCGVFLEDMIAFGYLWKETYLAPFLLAKAKFIIHLPYSYCLINVGESRS